MRHQDVGVAVVRRGERLLALRLELVVELLGDPGLELGDQRLDLEAGDQHADQPAHPADLGEVGQQGVTGARVLHLDGDLATVGPGRAVHLADRGGGGRRVVEVLEPVAPVVAELAGQHPVHRAGRQRRRGVLQPGERLAVGTGEVLGQRRLEDGHGLPELHRAALELAEHLEQLLRGARLDLGGDQLGGPPAQPPPETERGAAGVAER